MMARFFKFETIGIGSPYMTRLIIGRVRLHVFHRGDGDPDPHTHPWSFWTFPLTSYVEEVFNPSTSETTVRVVKAFRIHRRPSDFAHRVLGRFGDYYADHRPCWDDRKIVTLVWRGKSAAEWGFWKGKVLVPWRQYLGLAPEEPAQ